MEDHQPKKKRRPNFSDGELLSLVSAVSENQDILFGKFHLDNDSQARSLKTTAWQNVTDAVNSVSDVQRSVIEVRKKYKYFKSDVKKKAAVESQHYQRDDGYLSNITYTPAEKALHNLLEQHSAASTSAGPGLNDTPLALEEFSLFPEEGQAVEWPSSCTAVAEFPAQEPAPSTLTATSATSSSSSLSSTSLLSTTRDLLSKKRVSRRTFNRHRNQLPSHQKTMEEMLVVQTQIRDLLQDMNNTIATGFKDITAAIRYMADKSSQT